MAVLVEVTFPGATLDQYDEAIRKMGLTPGGRHPGALFHWVTETEDGFCTADVWESREAFERFAAEVAEIDRDSGLTESVTRYTEVHAYMTGPGSE